MAFSTLISLTALNKPNTRIQVAEDKSTASDLKGIKAVVEDALADLSDKLGKDGSLEQLMKDSGAAHLDTIKDDDGHTVMSKLDHLVTKFKKDVAHLMTEVDLMVGDGDDDADDHGGPSDHDEDDEMHESKFELPAKLVKVGYKAKDIGHHVIDAEGTKKFNTRERAEAWIAKNKKKDTHYKGKVSFGVTGSAGFKSLKPLNEEQLSEGKDYSDSGEFTDELMNMGQHILEMKKLVRQPRWKNWMTVTDHNFDTSAAAMEKAFADKLGELDKAYNALDDELHSAV